MKNILSYQAGSTFTGQEILDWINFQISHQTGAKGFARKLADHYTFIPNAQYSLIRIPSNSGCGAPTKIGFARVRNKTN